MQFTATYQKQGKWYLGWVEEIPGVNSQEKTLKAVKESLQEALALILETNRATLERERPRGRVIREAIVV